MSDHHVTQPRLIAVVDDDESVRRAFVRVFRSGGFDVVAFESAADFLDALQRMPIKCVVLDLQMPGMDGLDLQHHLCEAFPERKLPIVMISAHDEPKTEDATAPTGIVTYLRKPVESSVLLAAVRRVVAHDAP